MVHLLLFLSLIAGTTAEPYPLARVRFEGNLVLNDNTYRSLLLEWGYGRQLLLKPRVAARRLQRHLRRRGYTLAEVRAQNRDDLVVFRVDEGRLGKVIIFGRDTARTLQLKLRMSLPGNVFHRATVEQQLATIRTDFGIDSRYQLVRTGREHDGLQFDDLIESSPPRFELRIHAASGEWDDGLHARLHVGDADGVTVGISYGKHALFSDGDRWRVRAEAAGNRFESSDGSGDVYDFSRGILDARWFTAAFADDAMRSFFWMYGDFMVRGRPLEGIDFYRWVRTGVLANVSLEWQRGRMVALGLGGELRALVSIDQPGDQIAALEPFSQWRAAAVLQTELVFDPNNSRLDRRHELDAELRYLIDGAAEQQAGAAWRYRTVIELGWNDLWLYSRGAVLLGDYRIMDEEPLRHHVRSVFGQVFAPRLLSGGSEYRISLWRDLFKLSAYLETALYDPSRFSTDRAVVRLAVAAGVGINLLLLDFVQADLYWGGGWLSNNTWDQGVSLRLSKAY
jgi:hypothetical protein